MFKPDIYTVESVTAGHPDKICDQISDAILDSCLKQDPQSRVAVESFGSHGLLVIGGEITSKAEVDPHTITAKVKNLSAERNLPFGVGVDFKALAEKIYRDIGYKDALKIIVNIAKQSPNNRRTSPKELILAEPEIKE